MKSLLLVLIVGLFSFSSSAQTVNDVPLSEIDVEYVQIVGTGKLFKNDVTIQIDFGQKDKVFSTKDTRILDANGEDVVLHSMVDALNFMDSNGFEFVTAYAITIGNQNVYHYLLKRKE